MRVALSTHLDNRWRVCLEARFVVGMPAEQIWAELCDFRRFACMDWFHRGVTVDGELRAGARLVLHHGFFGSILDRPGRILWWREGRGYAFSDLSTHGPRRGFPHIYRYEIFPDGADRSCLRFTVAGVWTARFLPRPVVRLWLAWVLSKIVWSIRAALHCPA